MVSLMSMSLYILPASKLLHLDELGLHFTRLGFQAGIGAGGPITDHGGVATAGLRYMLMHTGITGADGSASSTIVLFPAWPCDDWAVHFKLHAPGEQRASLPCTMLPPFPRTRALSLTYSLPLLPLSLILSHTLHHTEHKCPIAPLRQAKLSWKARMMVQGSFATLQLLRPQDGKMLSLQGV